MKKHLFVCKPESPKAPTQSQEPNRRIFLSRSAGWLMGLSGLAIGSIGLRFTLADFEIGPPSQFAIGYPSEYKMHTLTWLRKHNIFVLCEEKGLGVFSARCTHLGCTVQRTSYGFHCPCHGARFGPLGQVERGPARKALPWYNLHIRTDGKLWIATNQPVESGAQKPWLSARFI